MAQIDNFSITNLDRIYGYDPSTMDLDFILDEPQNISLSNSEEAVDVTGKGGRRILQLKRNKGLKITGATGFISGGLLATQTGGTLKNDVETKDIGLYVTQFESITMTSTTVSQSLKFTAVGTVGNEIGEVFKKEGASLMGIRFTQAATPSTTEFSYNPSTKVLTFSNGANLTAGDEIIVVYKRNMLVTHITNPSDQFSKTRYLVIEGRGEDACNKIYKMQFVIPRASFIGNFELSMGQDPTVQNFEAESLPSSCTASGNLWDCLAIGANGADVPIV